MGIVTRQGSKNILWLHLGLVLGYLNIGLLMPRYLEPEAFGLTRTIFVFGQLVATFSQLGMGDAMIRFFPYFRDQARGAFLLFIFAVPLGVFLGIGSLALIFRHPLASAFADSSPIVLTYWPFLVPMGGFLLLYELLNRYSKSIFESVKPLFWNEVVQRLAVMGVIALFALQVIDFDVFFALYVGAHAIPALALWRILRKRGLRFSWSRRFFRRRYRKLLLHYGLFAQLNALNASIANRIDILMIGAILDQKQVALYALAALIGQVVQLPGKSLQPILQPLIADLMKNKAMDRMQVIYKQSALLFLILSAFVFTGIWSTVESIIQLFKPEYIKGLYVIFFIGLSDVIKAGSGGFQPILPNSKYYRTTFYLNLFKAFLLVVTNFFLIRSMGIIGAAIGSLVSTIIVSQLKVYLIWRYFRLFPYGRRFVASLLWVMGLGWLAVQLPQIQPFYLDIAYHGIVLILVYLAVVIGFQLSPELIDLINRLIRRTGYQFPNRDVEKMI